MAYVLRIWRGMERRESGEGVDVCWTLRVMIFTLRCFHLCIVDLAGFSDRMSGLAGWLDGGLLVSCGLVGE